jgi:hypothetical protein
MATPAGEFPTGIERATALVAVLITETELEPLFATYAWVPSGVKATPIGAVPDVRLPTSAFVPVLITETVLPSKFAKIVPGLVA